ncbi:hypothetical protein [Rodentibacter genomosp. 2]|uniref:Uncharacterized protein n=1 Tax=Rodentibacter genomosp. 2 TaxID=1908266 RepID=A0A1V3JCX5_9PAST|nr:hypothetical protein [Rodentibacter genomosp. 2]OOF54570.1 hypothetical protein BKK55_08785 [Rodentibacter genomosp. 2]
MQKYEYAITTAQIVDGYAKQKLNTAKEHELYSASWGSPFEITLTSVYKTLPIPKYHLNNSEQNIVDALQEEFELDAVSGVNTINKIAQLPSLLNRNIENITKAKAMLINQQYARLKSYCDIYARAHNQEIASSFFAYLSGLLWGFNYTKSGQQALIYTLDPSNDVLNPKQKEDIKDLVPLLNTTMTAFKTMITSLATVAEFHHFNTYSFDRVINETAIEIVQSGSYKQNGKRKYQRTKLIREIETIYRTVGIFGKEEMLTPLVLRQETKRIADSRKKSKGTIEIIRHSETLRLNDNAHHIFDTAQTQLSGATKLLSLSAVFSLLSDEKYHTKYAEIANDPTLTILLAYAEAVAPENKLGLKFIEQNGKMSLAAIHKETGMRFSSTWSVVRVGLINFTTALAGVGVLVEMANAHEASYKGDQLDYWGAMSRGVGSGLLVFAMPALGVGTVLTANGHMIIGRALMVLGSQIPYIGWALLLVGFALSAFKKEEMELWIENGFWGNSKKYWGDEIKAYEWQGKRVENEDFYVAQFEKSSELENVLKFYQIEMKRLFAFSQQAKIEAIDRYTFKITHPNIDSNEIAQQIKVSSLKAYVNKVIKGIYELDKRYAKINFTAQGEAIIHYPRPWVVRIKGIQYQGVYTKPYDHEVILNDNSIFRMSISLKLPRELGAESHATFNYEG